MTEHGLYDQACLYAGDQVKRLKFLCAEKVYARIGGVGPSYRPVLSHGSPGQRSDSGTCGSAWA
jgi:hypothetical protein